MTERPILFSGEMVRAILEGRKTQTRRVIKPQPELTPYGWGWWPNKSPFAKVQTESKGEKAVAIRLKPHCPYGQLGDRLWVRETLTRSGGMIQYAADCCTSRHLWPAEWKQDPRPSIHMHRWTSRITLEVTGVRVERLWDISDGDARAEGAPRDWPGDWTSSNCYKSWFSRLWNTINTKRGYFWDSNPWVWVVEFKAVQP